MSKTKQPIVFKSKTQIDNMSGMGFLTYIFLTGATLLGSLGAIVFGIYELSQLPMIGDVLHVVGQCFFPALLFAFASCVFGAIFHVIRVGT